MHLMEGLPAEGPALVMDRHTVPWGRRLATVRVRDRGAPCAQVPTRTPGL